MSDILSLPKSVELKVDHVVVLDQTKLPLEKLFFICKDAQEVWQAIKELKVRGAPAIGIAGAFGFYLGMRDILSQSKDSNFFIKAKDLHQYLNSSRPTAINLQWALDRMLNKVDQIKNLNRQQIADELFHEAKNIEAEDEIICRSIGEFGSQLIKDGMNLLTHCHTGSLAVAKWGTAIGAMHVAFEQKKKFHVYVDETRPLLQGARLTSWELMEAGIDCTLICDNMAGWLMSQGKIDLIIVGTDRVVRNGDVANKIGTLSLAILAKHFNIPFYVACPTPSIDLKTLTGKDILIESRDAQEITHLRGQQIAPTGVKTYNPAFDVTSHELVSGLITEKGILTYPYAQKLELMMKDEQ